MSNICRKEEFVPILAKRQLCGCVVCTCEDDEQCHGCGAHHCGTHPVGEIPNPIYESDQPSELDALRARVAELEAVLTRIRTEDLSRFDCTLLAAQAQGLLK